jgi:hypothetical protein
MAPYHSPMHGIAAALLASVLLGNSPASTNNDDSCDIGVAPAATLLLPYFEVSVNQPRELAASTLVTVVNVSNRPVIARMTLWTDWAYPVMTFNISLTGYGTASLDLYDLLTKGDVVRGCGSPKIPDSLIHDAVMALTRGLPAACSSTSPVGGTHANAVGYATIDLVANCGYAMPVDAAYYTQDLLFDNVLIGDYEQTWNGVYDAAGSPLVHIRAVPEGGLPGDVVGTNLPFTFYDRYVPTAKMDRRQPLPTIFAARYYDNATVATTWQMWREGGVTGRAACRDYAQNSKLKVAEMIRFDEHDNATTVNCWYFYWPCQFNLETAAVSAKPASDPFFPQASSSGDVGGWMYLNLDGLHNGAPHRPAQAWVVVRMTDARRAILYDAAHLGNGCSPPVATGATVAPAGGVPVCPTGSVSCTFDPRYFATNLTP